MLKPTFHNQNEEKGGRYGGGKRICLLLFGCHDLETTTCKQQKIIMVYNFLNKKCIFDKQINKRKV